MSLFIYFLIYMIALTLVEAIFALWLTGTKRFHRLGLRLMAMCVLTSWAVPYFCSCYCNGSCGNWTCPNFHDSKNDDEAVYQMMKEFHDSLDTT